MKNFMWKNNSEVKTALIESLKIQLDSCCAPVIFHKIVQNSLFLLWESAQYFGFCHPAPRYQPSFSTAFSTKNN